MRTVTALLLLALTAGAQTASAQTTSETDTLTFWLKGGVSLTTFGGQDVDEDFVDLRRKRGFLVGAAMDVPLGGTFSFQPEALFVTKGAKATDPFFIIEPAPELSVNLSYLEIPLLLKWTRDREADTSPFIYGGPSVSLKLRASEVITYGDGEEDSGEIDDIKGTDLGFVIGGGVRFGRFTIEGRFTRSLSTIAEDDVPVDVRNVSFAALFGFAVGGR